MLFGRERRLPYDLLFGRPRDTPSLPEEYLRDLQTPFEDVHNFARERISLATERMKTKYDIKATTHEFQEEKKCGCGTQCDIKDFLPSSNPTGTVRTQSLKD